MSDFPSAPFIDVSALSSASSGDHGPCVDHITDTVARTGTFVATGIEGGDRLDDLAATMLRFFELPADEKNTLAIRRYAPQSPYWYRGYVATPPERRFAYVEYFDAGPDRDMAVPALPFAEIFAERNHWPDREPCPDWRAAVMEYFGILEAFGTALLLGLAARFGLPADEVRARFEGGNSTVRLLHYPPRPAGVEFEEGGGRGVHDDPAAPPTAIGRHTDGCCLSLLWQREPGLQGQAPDGTWHEVPRAPHSVSVHLGDMVESLTGGRLPATPHRVLERHADRCSIGFFLEPTLVASCEPVGRPAHTGNPDLDSYAALLLRRFSRYPGYVGVVPSPD